MRIHFYNQNYSMIIHNPTLIRARLLVVEDDDLLLEVLCKTLENEGYQVDCAANGDEALEKLSTETYNTVILDLVFRKKYIQGQEVLKRIHAALPQLPVIVMSGSAGDETIVNTILSGGFSFLLKPIQPENLLSLVAEAVQKEQLSAHLSEHFDGTESVALIKGISGEMHVFVKQYALFFEAYVLQTKGKKVSLRLESDFDNIRVYFESDCLPGDLHNWFREYLAFTEQADAVQPVFNRPVSAERAALITAQLNAQIKHFAENIEWAFWRLSFDLKDYTREGVSTFFINPLKVINGLQIKAQHYSYDMVHAAGQKAAKEATALLGAEKTLEAFQVLLTFCETYGQTELTRELSLLKHRWNRAANEVLQRQEIGLEKYFAEMDAVQNALIFDIIPAVERLSITRRA